MVMGLRAFIIAWLVLGLVFFGCEDEPSIQGGTAPRITQPVTDTAVVLSSAERDDIARLLLEHRARTHVQIAVLTVETTQGEPIEDFSHQAAEAWGGGERGRDNGVLVTLAIQDRASRIEVGRGLEPVLTDGLTHTWLDAARPALRSGDYAHAIRGIVVSIINQTGALRLEEAVAVSPRVVVPASGVQEANDVAYWLFVALVPAGMLGAILWIFYTQRRAVEEAARERALELERRAGEAQRRREQENLARRRSDAERLLRAQRVAGPKEAPKRRERKEASVTQMRSRVLDVSREPPERPREEEGKASRRREEAEERREVAERKRRAEEEEDRRKRAISGASSYSSDASSSWSSGSSSSGSDYGGGGGGGGFDGGGSSGSW